MDIHTWQEYPKELIQPEIKPENRTGTIEQLAQNVEAVEKQVQLMGVGMSQNHRFNINSYSNFIPNVI
nr:hypothetical protein [uncultured Acetatifactor sp.]